MTNPHSTRATQINIRATANEILGRLQRGEHADALRTLEQVRRDERPVVQEALDRYVAADAHAELERLRNNGMPGHVNTLERLRQGLQPPRMPITVQQVGRAFNPDDHDELVGLTDQQKYDVYASMVATRGNQAATDALENNQSVLLGLRKETSTIASMDVTERRGTGAYDDQLVVLRKEANGEGQIFITTRASTEPTAQYDHHARPSATRSNTPYADVKWRRGEGEDANGDGTLDLGRLSEGTIEMVATDHANPKIAETGASFRPSPAQLSPARRVDMVERDTNGDGLFNQQDIDGVQDLNRSFKIHAGNAANTDSAGCQTIHAADYKSFIDAAQANSAQTRWQYVLTSTQDERERAGHDEHYNHQRGTGHGLFGDAFLGQCVSAATRGDSELLDQLAQAYAQTAEGKRMSRLGDALLAQHQAAQQQQSASPTGREDAVRSAAAYTPTM